MKKIAATINIFIHEVPTIKPASDRSILIQFGSKISADTHQMVVSYTEILLESYNKHINTRTIEISMST